MVVLPVPPFASGTDPVSKLVATPSAVNRKPAALKFAVLITPVSPDTDCTGAAAAAPFALTKALSLVKVESVILLVLILSAVIVPVSMLPPSIVVMAVPPTSENVPLEKVTTPSKFVYSTTVL